MLALLLGSASLRLTEWANAHAKVLDGVMIASTVLMLAMALFWFLTNDDSDDKSATHNGNSIVAGRDYFGDLINARDVHKGDVHHHYSSVTPEEPPALKPNLVISDPEPRILHSNLGYWKLSEKGTPAAIFWVHNRPSETTGGRTGDARAVSVGLTFREKGVVLDVVSHSCWIQHIENARDIGNNDRYAALIGTLHGPSGVRVFDNKTEMDRTVWLTRKPLPGPPRLESRLVPIVSMLEVDAVLTSEAETLAKRTFKFIRTADNEITIV
ncbi:MAG: hypothetical protein ABSF23_02485 [Terracidiphilus sp.]|jgi:hypothetical protein